MCRLGVDFGGRVWRRRRRSYHATPTERQHSSPRRRNLGYEQRVQPVDEDRDVKHRGSVGVEQLH